MKILIFTEGTIIMHKNAVGHTRDEIVKQVENKENSVHDYKSYVPVGNAVKKLQNWKNDGAEILYLTSRRKPEEIQQIQNVINKEIKDCLIDFVLHVFDNVRKNKNRIGNFLDKKEAIRYIEKCKDR